MIARDVIERHRVKSVVAPRGLDEGGELQCECGWYKRFSLVQAAFRAHARHVVLECVEARRAIAFAREAYRG